MLLKAAVGHNTQVLLQLASDGTQVVGVGGQVGSHFQTDDDVCPHLFADVHRQVVGDAAVGQQVPFPLHGGEENGDGHAGAQCASEFAATQHFGLAGHQVGGHAGKRDR